MIVEIRNDSLNVAINSLGAELHSLRATATDKEYLWQGKADVWSGRAPVLFPIIGALRHATAQFGDKNVSLSKHGFARHSEFNLINQSSNEATFSLRSDENTLKQFPWPFELQVHFQLTGRSLKIAYRVKNSGAGIMPFNIGSHPAFALDLKHRTHRDYCIEFSHEEELSLYGVTAEGLLAEQASPYPLKNRRIELSPEIFDNDALVFKHINSKKIHLIEKNEGKQLTVNTGGAPHLGIWAKPGSEFVCIEPWWGHADFDNAEVDMSTKSSLQTLVAGDVFETDIEITV